MKSIKKIGLFVIAVGAMFLLTGCGEKNVEGTLEDIMTKLYADIPEEERPMMLTNMEVNEENIEGFLGTGDIEYEEALASEPGISSIAHSVVLVRTKDNADIEKIKTTIKEKVNPRKWLCVGVEEDKVIVKNKGNLVILIMIEDDTTREKIDSAFDNL